MSKTPVGFDLVGKTVLISGGATGQGESEARLLVARGARVIIGDIDDVRGSALAQALGEHARFVHLDVALELDWHQAVMVALDWGGLQGLVNNAGLYHPARLLDTDVESFEQHYRVNQLGTFLGMKTCAAAMQASGGGAIVNIASVAAMRGTPAAFAYGASKWAVRGMSKSAALDLAARKIRVNSVYPGAVDTAMIAHRSSEERSARLARVPLARVGLPGEIAELVVFLLSDQSAFMTGAEIAIDGGAAL